MPFQREYEGGIQVINRDRTGPPRPPEPGIAQTSEGTIVGSVTDPFTINPGTEVKVNLPGPRESFLDARGNVSPKWYRFFNELYRRTGGPKDNVNFVGQFRDIGLTPAGLVLTGAAPIAQITHTRQMSVGSLTLTGTVPTL
jgi:hypothetical protein